MSSVRRRVFGLIMSYPALMTHLGFIYQLGNASETLITDTSSFFDAVLSGTALGIGKSWDSPASGQLRYISPIARDVIVAAVVSFTAVGANQEIHFDFAINSTPSAQGESRRVVTTGTDVGVAVVLMAETLSQNDILTLCVKNISTTGNVTVINLQLVAAALPT